MKPILSILAAAAISMVSIRAQAQGTGEYVAKVVLMDKLSLYVDWPNLAARQDRAFVLGVVGRTPFGDELDAHFQNRLLKGRSVRIRYFRGPEDIAECDLLFVCASEKDRLGTILAKVKSKPILTMGDTPGYAKSGVMLNLVRDGQRLAFEINQASVKESGLRMAASLLNLSKPMD